MDQVHVIRHKVLVEGLSARRVAREMGVSRNTVQRYLSQAAPTRVERLPRDRSVWEKAKARLEALLTESPQWTGGKQRLTAARLHRMLLAEGFTIGVTTVTRRPASRSSATDHSPTYAMPTPASAASRMSVGALRVPPGRRPGQRAGQGRFRRRCPEGLRNSPRPVRGRRRIRDARGSHSPLRAERQTDRPTRHQAGRVQGSGREDLRGLRTHVPVHRGALAADGQPRTSSRISPGAMSVETPSFVHAEFVNPAPHAPHFARSPTLTARRASPRETARDEEPWRLSLRAPPGRHRRSDCDR